MRTIFQRLKLEIEDAIRSSDFSAVEKIAESVERMVSVDFLTQSLSRWKIEELLNEMVNSYSTNKIFSILMVDVDNFKKINDSRGHNDGDDVLRGVSGVIKSNIRSDDLFGRWGGEEFLIMLHNTDRNDAKSVGERLRVATESSNVGATISLGCAQYIKGDTIRSLVGRADKFLYHSKKNGKNKCH